MKIRILIFAAVCGLSLSASAAVTPGLYQKMMTHFQNATAAATLTDFPSFGARNSLSCTVVANDDNATSVPGYMFLLQANINGQTVAKPVFAYVRGGQVPNMPGLMDLLSFSTEADGFHVQIAETDSYLGSPMTWIVRKSDQIYFTQYSEKMNDLEVGYCYPTTR